MLTGIDSFLSRSLPPTHSFWKQRGHINWEYHKKAHVVLWGSTNVAALALDALPAVGLHCSHHHWCELQACWMACREKRKCEKCINHNCTWQALDFSLVRVVGIKFRRSSYLQKKPLNWWGKTFNILSWYRERISKLSRPFFIDFFFFFPHHSTCLDLRLYMVHQLVRILYLQL